MKVTAGRHITPMLSIKDVAEITGVSTRQVSRWIAQGELDAPRSASAR